MQVWMELVIAGVLVIIASLFVAAETALSAIGRARAEKLVEAGLPGAQRVRDIAEDPAPYLNTALFVRTLFEISAIILVALAIFESYALDWQRIVIAILVMLAVSFIVWGVAPRTLGRQHAEAISRLFAPLVSMLTTVLGPVASLMILLGNLMTPGRGFTDGPFSTEAELREFVDIAEASKLIEAGERKMLHSVFDFGDTICREVMVPRPDVVYIESTKTLRQAISLALRSGFSRIPVTSSDGLDDVLGVIYLKDVVKRVFDNSDAQTDETVATLMREPVWCPDSKPIDELLAEMQRTRSHLVLVVDEFGGTSGLATIEDILEEIVGEIVDEYDEEVPPVVDLGGDQYRVSARLAIDELGELFGLDLEDEDVDTVAGFMAKQLNRVPIPGTTVTYEGLQLTAEKALGRRNQVGTILARRQADGEGEENE
ncbi:MAG: hypothetical protein CSA63_01440 [Propionibacterium sp.]|nr:MAG: hypothetical protein CSA63_01440 [Propionibacterium sp.]